QYCGKRSTKTHLTNWSDDPMEAIILASKLPEEVTVSKLSDKIGLIATYMDPYSSQIMLCQATHPDGPWSLPIKAFDCSKATSVAYEAVNHPELAGKPDELVVSYFSNFQQEPTRQIPQFVHIGLSNTADKRLQQSHDYQLSRNF
ncbi:MAG: hypothetical protein K2X29_10560, partial [Candidatus Obscuribacterales bacterium]|nr:hypothetical protein [Candidatus Obscuribacterales bacterium]